MSKLWIQDFCWWLQRSCGQLAVVFTSLPQGRHPETVSVICSALQGVGIPMVTHKDVLVVEFAFACPLFMHFQNVREREPLLTVEILVYVAKNTFQT